jgi:hypothetical protein
MSKLHIDVAEHGVEISVSEMRKLLARTLSQLKGENKVTFSFHCQVELLSIPSIDRRAVLSGSVLSRD